MKTSITIAALTLIAGSTFGQCGGADAKHKPAHMEARHEAKAGTIVEVADKAGTFKTLLAAAQAAGLAETLNGPGPLTVFAPTDEAFAKLPKGTVETLLKPENKEMLKSVLLYHVVSGKVESGQAVKLAGATTVGGQRLDLAVKSGGLTIDGAKVVAADVAASNGVIHVIDTVLMPATANLAETAKAAGTFNTLLAAAKAAGLDGALAGKDALTVLAPTDEAFAKLPKGTVESLLKPENKEQLKTILSLHIIPGRLYSDAVAKASSAQTIDGQTLTPKAVKDGLTINGAKVVKADIDASNGVVHVIDAVILPK